MDTGAIIEAMRACGHDDGAILAVVQKLEEARRERTRAASAARQRAFKARHTSNEVTPVTEVTQVTQVTQVTRESVTDDPSRGDIYTTRAPALIPVGLSNDNPPINNPLLVPPSPETAPRKASRAKARTQIDENQLPTEADSRNAEEAGLTGKELVAEWRRFRDHHRAKGSLMADWSAAWRTWLGNRDRFAQPRAGPPRERGGFATMLMESIEAMNGRKNASNSENLPALSFDHGAAGSGKTGHDGGIFGRLPRPDG